MSEETQYKVARTYYEVRAQQAINELNKVIDAEGRLTRGLKTQRGATDAAAKASIELERTLRHQRNQQRAAELGVRGLKFEINRTEQKFRDFEGVIGQTANILGSSGKGAFAEAVSRATMGTADFVGAWTTGGPVLAATSIAIAAITAALGFWLLKKEKITEAQKKFKDEVEKETAAIKALQDEIEVLTMMQEHKLSRSIATATLGFKQATQEGLKQEAEIQSLREQYSKLAGSAVDSGEAIAQALNMAKLGMVEMESPRSKELRDLADLISKREVEALEINKIIGLQRKKLALTAKENELEESMATQKTKGVGEAPKEQQRLAMPLYVIEREIEEMFAKEDEQILERMKASVAEIEASHNRTVEAIKNAGAGLADAWSGWAEEGSQSLDILKNSAISLGSSLQNFAGNQIQGMIADWADASTYAEQAEIRSIQNRLVASGKYTDAKAAEGEAIKLSGQYAEAAAQQQLAAVFSSLAQEAGVKAVFATAEALLWAAAGNFYSAGLAGKAALLYGSIALGSGLASYGISSGRGATAAEAERLDGLEQSSRMQADASTGNRNNAFSGINRGSSGGTVQNIYISYNRAFVTKAEIGRDIRAALEAAGRLS